MKDKIKKFYAEHEVWIAFTGGLIVACALFEFDKKIKADNGYMTVKPNGYDNNGVLHVYDLKGRDLEARLVKV